MIGFMWLGRIAPSLINGTSPEGLEHYTTLVIQTLDLGFIVPAAMLSGVLLIKRKPFGYLLSSIIIIKGVTLLTAIIAMAIRMLFAGVKVSFIELILFSFSKNIFGTLNKKIFSKRTIIWYINKNEGDGVRRNRLFY
jgi:hypothetical protein